jgi:hypothetical protein
MAEMTGTAVSDRGDDPWRGRCWTGVDSSAYKESFSCVRTLNGDGGTDGNESARRQADHP